MEIYPRIKTLRKTTLKLTQDEFSAKINVSRSNLANIETGRINITDRNILDICREFNVNEDWLRTGQGNMFIESNQTLLDEFVKENNLKESDKKLFEAYLKLSDNEQNALTNALFKLAANISAPTELSATLEIDQEVEDYRQELKAEKKGVTLSVLGDIKEAK